jgi:UDP-N-acetylglucosamine:LPS N-acetylglucosamine transferase
MFGRKNAAQIIRDADLKPELLLERVKSIVTSTALLQSMAEATRTFAKLDATQAIVAEILNMAGKQSANTHEHEGVSI